jgi:Domain of unknown function (DUF4920)
LQRSLPIIFHFHNKLLPKNIYFYVQILKKKQTMKKIISILALSIMSMAAFAQESTSYGDVKVDATLAKEASAVLDLLKTDTLVEDVTISGKIKGVCQAKGCWMTIELANGEEMTVKFKDYAFFMPLDCAGRNIVAHGKTFIKTTSVAELQHLAEDAGKSKKEIKKIKKAKKAKRFEADGVILMA